MNVTMEFLKKYFQSFRLQRSSVTHSVRKNEKALRSYRTFLRKSSNIERNWNIFIPSPVFNVFIHRCIFHKKQDGNFHEMELLFSLTQHRKKIIIPYSGINQPDSSEHAV